MEANTRSETARTAKPPRIPYDSLTVRAVVQELEPALTGGFVQHIAQPVPTELLLSVRNQGANQTLLLSCDAANARAYLTVVKRPNPPAPPAFCMLCRKYIEGARIVNVSQRGFDRVLDITLLDREGDTFLLTAELMGKHSNLILTNAAGTILDAAKRITRRTSRFREVLPGVSYLAPPASEAQYDPLSTSARMAAERMEGVSPDPEAQTAHLMAHFAGLSPFLANEVVLRAAQSDFVTAWEALFGAARRGEWSPVVVRNPQGETIGAYPFPTVQYPANAEHARDRISTALDHYYSTALPRADRDSLRQELETALDRALRSREKQRESVLRSLEEVNRAEQHKQTGELLLANLHQIPPQSDSVTLLDYYADPPIERTITLDPLLGPRENADAYFRRYRKARDGAEIQRQQLTRLDTDLDTLRHLPERLAEAKDVEALRTLRKEWIGTGLLRGDSDRESAQKKTMPDFQGKKIRVYHTSEGWDILLGENSEANDFLTGRVAASNDIWLHVRAGVSAHVVIRTGNRPEQVPQNILMQAALLAARNSPAKHSSLVPVDYTLKKYVRRPRGAPSGTVFYQNEKTLFIEP